MKSIARFFSVFGATAACAGSLLAVPVHLRTNYRESPIGLDSAKPHFLWQSEATERNWTQSGYRVRVASAAKLLASGTPDLWDSGKRSSDESVDVPYEGKPLAAERPYVWTVEVWDSHGQSSTSAPASFETGPMQRSDWQGRWIGADQTEAEADHQAAQWIVIGGASPDLKAAAIFRKTIMLTGAPYRATFSVIANGGFESFVNGRPIDHKEGWRSFDFHEIHADLHAGENVIEVRAAHPDVDNRTRFLSTCAIAALVKITAKDGSVHRFGTGTDWIAGQALQAAATTPAALATAGSYLADSGPTAHAASLLQKSFAVNSGVRSARLYITALGSYRAFLNGTAVSDAVLTPDFTDYRKRVTYQTYDATNLLRSGQNQFRILLGPGWYGSGLTWAGAYSFGTAAPSVLAQLVVEMKDGKRSVISTDASWQSAPSPILNSEIYAGETYDARLAGGVIARSPARADHGTVDQPSAAIERAGPAVAITAQEDLPVHRNAEIAPVRVTMLKNGDAVFDMGQNMVGWTRLTARGEAGRAIHLQYAERLNPDGGVYTDNLRSAEANDTYILRGSGTETYEPFFTFHGFRYVQVNGYPGTPTLASLAGEVMNSLPKTPSARLMTSSDLVNRMWTAGLWGQRGNFLSIPTDCPQRDERLGWMGDAGVFWRTGAYNFDIASFTHKFMNDVDDAQTADGAFTNISPNLLRGIEATGAPGWGDAGVIVPYTAWLQYGDRSSLDQNWSAMTRWMSFIEHANPDHLRRKELGPNYGDWLAPDQGTPRDLVGTAYWAMLAQMMSVMAEKTGRSDEAHRYATLHSAIRKAYRAAYMTGGGDIAGHTQTGYLLTLSMHLAPADQEEAIANKLVADIDAHGVHLTTGFLGTPFLLSALDEQGKTDTAYKLLLSDTYPSWGYMIAKGATTWWERWNGDTGDPSMNSYNHYAFGSVMAWVYRRVAGIDTSEDGPGFHHVLIAPQRSALMTSASAEYDSVYGKISTRWKTDGKRFALDVTIPANATATITLPDHQSAELFEDGKPLSSEFAGKGAIEVGSGSYHFESRAK